MTDVEIHDRDLDWLLASDVVVAEVTTASLGVGYELGRGIEHGKNILCLYREQPGKRLSAMVSGCEKLTNVTYETLDDATRTIDAYIAELSY